jgi:hypothetical protein
MTMGAKEYADNVKAGFREVTAEEQDAFRAETKALKEQKKPSKAKGKKAAGGLVINATAAELAKLVEDFNK